MCTNHQPDLEDHKSLARTCLHYWRGALLDHAPCWMPHSACQARRIDHLGLMPCPHCAQPAACGGLRCGWPIRMANGYWVLCRPDHIGSISSHHRWLLACPSELSSLRFSHLRCALLLRCAQVTLCVMQASAGVGKHGWLRQWWLYSFHHHARP